jgi:cytochrome c oxidase subunit 2
MTTTVEVMPIKVFESWYAGKTEAEGGARKLPEGAKLVQEKGCVACHSLDGTAKVGPTLQGVYGRKEFVVTAGKEHQIVVSEDYLKRSLLDPQSDIVKGFPPIMPTQKGLLKDDEIDAIIEYLKTL